MKRRKADDDAPPGAGPWITSYADMTQLLLTFFVLLFALSSLDAAKFKQGIVSIQGALGVLPGSSGILPPGELPAPRATVPEQPEGGDAITLEDVMQEFQTFFRGEEMSDRVHMEMTRRGLVVSLMDKVLFDLGQAALRPDARRVLSEVSVILRKIPNAVRIEGHTCNLPINTPEFPSNWELSTARACAVLRYFVEVAGLSPERFAAMGYGEFRPKVPNTNEANRALNRRVDIVILDTEADIPDTETAE